MSANNSSPSFPKEITGTYYIQNGKLVPVRDFDGSFLQHPYYIYEVFRVIDGIALFLEDHLQRLEHTCTMAGTCKNIQKKELEKQVYQIIESNNVAEGNLKIVGIRDQDEMQFLIYSKPHQYPSEYQYQKGVDVLLFSGNRRNPNAKIMDAELRKNNRHAIEKKGVYETLLVNNEGFVTEGSSSNVFFVRNDEVLTPPLEDVLPGVTRKNIMDVCRENKIKIREVKIPARSLVVMEAVFISGTSKKVLPVKKIDGLDFFVPHPLVEKIGNLLNARVKAYIQDRQKNA
ncbi:MAG: aminotransferase class IV [Bacteroidales bacterium]